MKSTSRRAVQADLLAVVLGGALMAIGLFLVPGAVALRAVTGLPFLILGPGYALTSALFPLEPPEPSMRVALSLGLSIASVVLAGLVLNAARIELTAHALAVAVLMVAVAGCAVAALRRGPGANPISLPAASIMRSPWLWSTAALLAVFAALLVLLARPLPDPTFAGYTQLTALRTASTGINVSVRSAEHATTSFRLVATTASGRTVARGFSLAPGQEWAGVLPTGAPPDQTLHVRLYRSAEPGVVYREVIPRA